MNERDCMRACCSESGNRQCKEYGSADREGKADSGGEQPRQDHLPLQHEPRYPHPHERDHGLYFAC